MAAEPGAEGGREDGLVRAVTEALGGFELLDRRLQLAAGAAEGDQVSGRPIDLVGLGPTGRLALVLELAPAETDGALEFALDLLALGRARRAQLERHLERSLPQEPPLVVLVAADFPELLARRLGAVGSERLVALAARSLRSGAGATVWYERVGAAPEPEEGHAVQAFLAGLAPGVRDLAGALEGRLRRLDRGVAARRTPDGLDWRWRGRSVCSAVPSGVRLEGRVELDGVAQAWPIADPTALERFLDLALTRFLALHEELAPTA